MTEQATEGFDLDQMKDKISKLLAKAEATTNDHERDAFTKKAEELMIRLGVTAAELEAAGTVKPEEIIEVAHAFFGVYSSYLIDMAAAVGAGFGHVHLIQREVRPRTLPDGTKVKQHHVLYVVGHKTDAEQFLALIQSLGIQAETARERHRRDAAKNDPEYRYLSRREKYDVGISFLRYFGRTVRDRLKAMRETEEAVASPGAALVLVGKDERIKDHLAENYNLKDSKARAERFNQMGAVAGTVAGHTANLGEKGVTTGRAGVLG